MISEFLVSDELKNRYYEQGYWTAETIETVWNRQSGRFSSKVYVKDNHIALTYRDVDKKAARLAYWLSERGVSNGDVLTFQVPMWAEFCIIYVAALKLGAVMHPLPKNFNTEDLVRAMTLVGSSALICPTFDHKTNYEQQAEEVSEQLGNLKAVVLIDKFKGACGDFPVLSNIVEEGPKLAPLGSGAKSDDIACILSTSGTTGIPKAALLTHNNILFSERSMIQGFGFTADDTAYMASPLNHATGFFHGLLIPMLSGATCILDAKFSPESAIDRMNSEGCTWSMAATPFIYDILQCMRRSQRRTKTLRLWLCGGAPVPSSLIQSAREHGITLCEIYGSTESCPHIYVPPAECLNWNGSWSGVPFEGIEVKVAQDDIEVPIGEQGEELSRGPHLFVGYINNKGANNRALTSDGWFRSGDLCYQDEQGRIRINGRKKEIIIRGGENISANEIDAALVGCPGIADHATIGMPDDRLGERICTFVVATRCNEADRPTVASLAAYLESKHVQKRLWPERVEVIDEIPRTATMKTKRHQLADELARRMKSE
ncbi:AMP-binding protein [Berryella wangjianweii]|uniref:AMP-binding protein n=1 Tax=Berryella wangjianweii TaxID=2734634 RepID=A0A6M8J2X5_9ACTN|nr:AMP-binding protein [Berryella wangjianweii]QKF07844.1 AMP-binding protein [Berryella wangjianweii]